MEEMFSAKEVATLFNISSSSINNYRASGELKAQRIGHQFRYRLSALVEFFEISEEEILAGMQQISARGEKVSA